ncbi:MAG TPA: DUF1345 domain-containing protein [Methylocella sp.]|nr:DUF1345 domain-containing protein [Methylocella sp.]
MRSNSDASLARRCARPLLRLFRILWGHKRLFSAAAIGAGTAYALPAGIDASTLFLLAWNAGTWFYFTASAIMIARASPQSIRWRAQATDEGKFFILLLTGLAAAASIAAIAMQLAAVKNMSGLTKGLHVALAAITILSAWTFTHLTFALHYAHEYFDVLAGAPGKPAEERRGLIFPGTKEPDYYDFLYFSYIIGVACQTADVAISSPVMRRTALVHGILSFFFNSAVLALTVNLAAGLI